MKTLITNAVVLPMTAAGGDAQKYFNGSVGIENDRIVLVADDSKPSDAERVAAFKSAAAEEASAQAAGKRRDDVFREIDARGGLLMPGLVNTHTHVSMTLLRNMADDLPLMTWLNDHIWPYEATMGPEDIAEGARIGFEEMLRGGTTTLVDMYWYEAAVGRTAVEAGIRTVLCPTFVDAKFADFEADLPETLAVAAAHPELLSVRIAPHAAYTCSPENLKKAVALARENGLGLHIHLSETMDEQRMVAGRYGCTPTEHLLRTGLFELPTIAAHSIYLSDGDIEILRDNGVTAAHNPQSNMKLASGTAQVAKLLERGVNVSLGTDGASSNNDLDMFEEMRSASLLGKLTAMDPAVLPAYEVLQMATVNGARAIGMEGRLGILKEGALADMILIDLDKPHFKPHRNLTSALVYCAKSSDVSAVFVNGKQLV